MFLFNSSTRFLFISFLDGQEDEEWAEERMDGWDTELYCMPAAVFADLEGDRAGGKAGEGEQGAEKWRYGEWRVESQERWRERGERSTNLKERISSGRVIKSESQQTYPPFSPLCSHPFSVITRLSLPELSSHFSLSF